jgi:hypothetical protein
VRADLARACVIAVLLLAGCGADEAEPPVAEESAATQTAAPPEQTPPPAGTPAPPADDGAGSGGASPAINSVTVDPGDGTIMVGAGPALYRVEPGSKKGEEVVGELDQGTVSGNLVVRFAGPNDLLASGHPKEGSLPENIGLMRSSDHGDTWALEDGVEEADYHELEVVGDQLIAVEVEAPDIKVSRDGGRSWETRTPPDAPIDVVVNPRDPDHWAVSTEQGTFVSTNGGQSWRPRDTTFGARLIWPSEDALFSIDRNGTIRVSKDGGRSFQDRGEVGGLPSEVTSGRQNELLVAVIGGKIKRSRDGGKSWSTAATLR